MKYRVYRLIGSIEYKDVEVANKDEASKCFNHSKDGFLTIDSGYILNYWIDDDLKKEKKYEELKTLGEN